MDPVTVATTGGLLGMGEAATAGLAGTLGTGVLASLPFIGGLFGGGGDDEGGGVTGGTMIRHPLWSFTEGRLQDQSDLLRQQIGQQRKFYGTGELPAWLQSTAKTYRDYLREPLRRRTFGTPAARSQSAMSVAQQIGSQAGIGAKGQLAQGAKAWQEYDFQEAQIDRFIATYGPEMMTRIGKDVGYLSAQMPQGPPVSVTGAYAIPEKPDYFSQALSSIGSSLPALLSSGQNINLSPGQYETAPDVMDAEVINTINSAFG